MFVLDESKAFPRSQKRKPPVDPLDTFRDCDRGVLISTFINNAFVVKAFLKLKSDARFSGYKLNLDSLIKSRNNTCGLPT